MTTINKEIISKKEDSNNDTIMKYLEEISIISEKINNGEIKVIDDIKEPINIYTIDTEDDVIDILEVYLVRMLERIDKLQENGAKREADNLLVQYMELQFMRKVHNINFPIVEFSITEAIKSHPVAFSKSVS